MNPSSKPHSDLLQGECLELNFPHVQIKSPKQFSCSSSLKLLLCPYHTLRAPCFTGFFKGDAGKTLATRLLLFQSVKMTKSSIKLLWWKGGAVVGNLSYNPKALFAAEVLGYWAHQILIPYL